MATWGLHMMVVDKLYELGLSMDKRGFAVGNIAPDCNIENEDWTEFEPPKSVTHWMKGNNKLSADYEEFYNQYIKGRDFETLEESSFLFGYYSHLITDVEFQKFVRDKKRVKNIYDRLKSILEFNKMINGEPENFDTIKKNFGKQNIFLDIYAQEIDYLKKNPKASYNTILKKIDEFSNYIDYMPEGAIARKLKIITSESNSEVIRENFIFFTIDEINEFIDNTAKIIRNELLCKKVWKS